MKIKFLTAIGTSAALLVSCSQKADQDVAKAPSIDLEYHSVEQAFTLEHSMTDFDTDTDLTMGCRAKFFIPNEYLGSNIKAFRDSILDRAFDTICPDPAEAARSYFVRISSDAGYPLMPLTIADADSLAEVTESLNNYDGSVEVRGNIASLCHDYVSYAILHSSYMPRAAHGMYGTEYLVFSIQADKILSISDLFTPEGLEALPQILRRKARSMAGYIGATDIQSLPAGGNFYINNPGNLIFSYQPYEIASYAQGQIDIEIEPYVVSDYLTALGKKILLNE